MRVDDDDDDDAAQWSSDKEGKADDDADDNAEDNRNRQSFFLLTMSPITNKTDPLPNQRIMEVQIISL